MYDFGEKVIVEGKTDFFLVGRNGKNDFISIGVSDFYFIDFFVWVSYEFNFLDSLDLVGKCRKSEKGSFLELKDFLASFGALLATEDSDRQFFGKFLWDVLCLFGWSFMR